MKNSATCIDLEEMNERNTYASQPPVSDGSNNGTNPTETEADAGKSSAEPQNVSQADKEPHANNPKSFKERMGNVEYRKELMNALQCILLSLGGMITAPTLVQRYNCLVCLLIDPQNIKGACAWTSLRKSAVYELRNRLFSLNEPSDIESLFRDKPGRGPKNRLDDIKDVIIDLLETKNLHTIQEIQDAIKERTGVTCNRKTLSEFLRDNNYKKLKCGSIPAKADIGKQVEFYKDLQALMDQAKKGEIELFFVDASHFVFGGDYCGYVYCQNRRFLRTWNGRKRYNVLGALHYATNEILTVTDDTHIDSIVVRKLLDLLHERYPLRQIYLVLDNARYQPCSFVTDYMDTLGIVPKWLPTYSPNLNLIERAWGFTKRELRKASYLDYESFRSKIDEILSSTTGANKEKFATLIGGKIQLFDRYTCVDEQTVSSPDRRKGSRSPAA